MISLQQAEFSVTSRQLLAPLDLCITPGKVLGLIGHNGSGKSTLIKLLARQHAPTKGSITLDGQRLCNWGVRRYARRVAYLPQYLPAVAHLTGRELIALGRYPWKGPLGRRNGKDIAAIARAISLTETENLLDRMLDTLSGGERQRVWLAMLLAQESQYLLLDEPLASLDLSHQSGVMGLIQSLARDFGLSVVVSIHDINLAARYCDQLIALHGGRLIHRGRPGDIMQRDVLRAIYGVDMHVIQHPDDQSAIAFV